MEKELFSGADLLLNMCVIYIRCFRGDKLYSDQFSYQIQGVT